MKKFLVLLSVVCCVAIALNAQTVKSGMTVKEGLAKAKALLKELDKTEKEIYALVAEKKFAEIRHKNSLELASDPLWSEDAMLPFYDCADAIQQLNHIAAVYEGTRAFSASGGTKEMLDESKRDYGKSKTACEKATKKSIKELEKDILKEKNLLGN
jgi:hypothetical protein